MIVVPFKGSGKSRLPPSLRHELSLAMLGDVLTVTVAFGPTCLVTDGEEARAMASELGVSVIADPGRGQGAAVAAGLAEANDTCLVVNSDLPALTRSDLDLLAASALRGQLGVAEAADGTTNALALPRAACFADLYGPGSAARFRAHAAGLSLAVSWLDAPNLVDDVDTVADLERIGDRAGERTRHLLALAR